MSGTSVLAPFQEPVAEVRISMKGKPVGLVNTTVRSPTLQRTPRAYQIPKTHCS
ncbi:hypothetical protein SS1G_07803 [Sclerotinia sclerotiorum 1980 UF-70]|uniref:Uncharacterized protein n=1 Tax=Sclerotinia sclerotiorum (strain ATCC 18683 / 1980 / Ss-1) TaxID=665079 RepID=A7ER50_SCLS1|nr:hypothetical protein SS1G_07803 [Sclerotinia sclerotiorum 1980 UF-70]EDN91942.1 hypothetical protein SS1G_07803 [Sclerotinia sclerotiorum 1980 UF-70]